LEYRVALPLGVAEVRGTAGLGVNDPAFIGAVVASDNGGPTPNARLLTVDLGATQAVLQVFDFANSVSVGPDVFIPVVGTPLSPLTDPALIALLQPYIYRFSFTTEVPVAGGSVFVFSFIDAVSASSIPEPASLGLVPMGFAGLFFARRKFREEAQENA
jgi:hypothetical protein